MPQSIVKPGMTANLNTAQNTMGTQAGGLITSAFNHQIYDLNNMDVQHMQLYDTITIAASGTVSQNTVSFFSNVGPQSGKTEALTNIATPRQLQTPQAFSIMSTRLRWAENILLADLYTVLGNFAYKFWIGGKFYQEAPLWIFAAGGGIYCFNSSATVASNGLPDRAGMNRLNIPLVIDNTAQFYGEFVGTPQTLTSSGSSGTGATFQLVLDGFWARGIQ